MTEPTDQRPPPRWRILLADGDGATRQALAEQLRLHDEFVILEAPDLPQALALAGGADAVVIDALLPDPGGGAAGGLALCRQLRADGLLAPLILLTAGGAAAGAGANDHIAKPFRLELLLGRLRALLRQADQAEDGELPLGPYLFRPAAKLLLRRDNGLKLRLTEKETAILRYLLRAGGVPVGREQLLGKVWGYNAGVTTHTLETHIYRLRRKIEADPAAPRLLLTDPGGYRLVP